MFLGVVQSLFSHDVTAAILVYKTMNRRPCLGTKKFLRELNSFHMLQLSLLQAICKAADHVTENDLLNKTPYSSCNMYTPNGFFLAFRRQTTHTTLRKLMFIFLKILFV